MKLIDLLTTGKQIKIIPKTEIPALLGEIETLKARLWVRLIEPEEMDSVILFGKTASEQTLIEIPAKHIPQIQIPKQQKQDSSDQRCHDDDRIIKINYLENTQGRQVSQEQTYWPETRGVAGYGNSWMD